MHIATIEALLSMTTYAGLVRGINVGKARRLAMADLRALVEAEGFTDPRTLLNSGNVVFAGAKQPFPRMSPRASRAPSRRGSDSGRTWSWSTPAWVDAVVRENTLTQADNPSRLLVAFVQDTERLQAVRRTRVDATGAPKPSPSARAPRTSGCPTASWRAASSTSRRQRLGPWITTRNWATVQKMHAMMR